MPKAYIRWLEALADERPLILVLEDVQWADVPTRELAAGRARAHGSRRLALVLTDEPIAGSEGAALRLRALSDYPTPHDASWRSAHSPTTPSGQLLSTCSGGRHRCGRRVSDSSGRPKGIRSTSRSSPARSRKARSSHAGERGRSRCARPSCCRPPSRTSSWRVIDRLAEGPRRLAQVAAAVGRTFSVAVLERVVGEDVTADLSSLLRTEIVRELRRYPEFECGFTHGLLQEAALSTLTATGRRDLYATGGGCLRGALRGLARRARRAARPLPRAGRKPAAGARVRGARSSGSQASARATSSPLSSSRQGSS